MKWYSIEQRMPKSNRHILAELDDYTIMSGNMAMTAGGEKVFAPDHGWKLYYPDEILRWCKYPEGTEE